MKHKLSKSFKKILGAERQPKEHDFKNENTGEDLGKNTTIYQIGKHEFTKRDLYILDKRI